MNKTILSAFIGVVVGLMGFISVGEASYARGSGLVEVKKADAAKLCKPGTIRNIPHPHKVACQKKK